MGHHKKTPHRANMKAVLARLGLVLSVFLQMVSYRGERFSITRKGREDEMTVKERVDQFGKLKVFDIGVDDGLCEKFAQEYIVDFNATSAYIRARDGSKVVDGPTSRKGVYDIGSRLKKACSWRIAELLAKRNEATAVSAEYVIHELVEGVKKSSEGTLVTNFRGEPVTVRTEDGEIKAVYKYDSIGRNKALELLGKHLGMFTDKVEVKGDLSIATALAKARARVSTPQALDQPTIDTTTTDDDLPIDDLPAIDGTDGTPTPTVPPYDGRDSTIE